MSRRRKDPLRSLIENERRELLTSSRSSAAPAVRVARRPRRHTLGCRRWFRLPTSGPRGRSQEWWCGVPSGRPVQPRGTDGPRPAARRGVTSRPTTQRPRIGSCGRPPAPRPRTPTAPPPGRWRSCAGCSGRPPMGLPQVSTFTIWQVLRGAGYTFQRTRTWCPTGSAVRKRKTGAATVTDPDAGAKKS